MDASLLAKSQPPTTTQDDNGQEPSAEQSYRTLEVELPKRPLQVILDKPIEYDGETFKTLTLDFESMTGKDFLRAEREFSHLYKPERNEMVLPEMKHLYHEIIAAHRANVPLGVIQKLPRRYYVPLRLEVLKACGSSPDSEND
jgi:hypothetical protein